METENDLHKFGTRLPDLEVDKVPSKKPVHVQDQIATDEFGRRRFHGAFTGGFSAGYWNTVGSKEGWTPQSFKSSRSEKGSLREQRAEDFMDEEDLNEFGTAKNGLIVDDDYDVGSTSSGKRQRKLMQPDLNLDTIPGEPILNKIIEPLKSNVAIRILQNWGWKPGQGIGPRQTQKEKTKSRTRNRKELYLLEKYGCDLPQNNADDDEEVDDDDDNIDEKDITFAPEDYDIPPYQHKNNQYGIGYEQLSAANMSSRCTTLIASSTQLNEDDGQLALMRPLEVLDKCNRKISFRGHAFGIGALEDNDEDDDVYTTQDMSKYDFSLDNRKGKKPKTSKADNENEEFVYDFFILDKEPPKHPVFRVDVPFDWQPRKWSQRKSRFEPLTPRKVAALRKLTSKQSRELTREQRVAILQDPAEQIQKRNNSEQNNVKGSKEYNVKQLLEKISMKTNSFTTGGIINLNDGNDITKLNDNANEVVSNDDHDVFKPFINNGDKQQRYERFVNSNITDEIEIEKFINDLQPDSMSTWEKQLEVQEFKQAKKLYKSSKYCISDRFVRATGEKSTTDACDKDKLYELITCERSKSIWKPNALLCKRYNIQDPYVQLDDADLSASKKPKLSIFSYLGDSLNKKEDFRTPVIIPKNNNVVTEKPKVDEKKKSPLRMEAETMPEQAPSKPTDQSEEEVKESDIDRNAMAKIFGDSDTDDEEGDSSVGDEQKTLKPPNSNPIPDRSTVDDNDDFQPTGIFKWLAVKHKPAETEKTPSTPVVKEPPTEMPKIIFQRPTKSDRKSNELENVYGPALPSGNERTTTSAGISNKNSQIIQNTYSKAIGDVTKKWSEKHGVESDYDTSQSSDESGEEVTTKRSKKKSKKASDRKRKHKSKDKHKHKHKHKHKNKHESDSERERKRKRKEKR